MVRVSAGLTLPAMSVTVMRSAWTPSGRLETSSDRGTAPCCGQPAGRWYGGGAPVTRSPPMSPSARLPADSSAQDGGANRAGVESPPIAAVALQRPRPASEPVTVKSSGGVGRPTKRTTCAGPAMPVVTGGRSSGTWSATARSPTSPVSVTSFAPVTSGSGSTAGSARTPVIDVLNGAKNVHVPARREESPAHLASAPAGPWACPLNSRTEAPLGPWHAHSQTSAAEAEGARTANAAAATPSAQSRLTPANALLTAV